MIKNIIFDLGNVLISFNPSEYLKINNYPREITNIILNDIFEGPEWRLLDNGDITLEEAISCIEKKSSLRREEIALIFTKRTEIIYPLENNVRLLPELKKQGFKLYYLSNFPLDIFDEVKNGYSFFKYFDGGIISAEVKYSKPDPGIFELFFEKFHIDPRESLYIDDIESNVTASVSLGTIGLVTFGSSDISEKVYASISSVEKTF
jgi:glucose-1-phosphatase